MGSPPFIARKADGKMNAEALIGKLEKPPV